MVRNMATGHVDKAFEQDQMEAIARRAKAILDTNWVGTSSGGFTRPAEGIYPYQWNWDAGFIAYGYSHYNPQRAVAEMRSLFSGQWENGFLPHIIFHASAAQQQTYTPGPDFWDSRSISDAPTDVATSGLTQPPVHAMAIWHIYKVLLRQDKAQARALLEEFYPKLLALHRYLYTVRDPEEWGLITIYHPWESGFDNSPRWDAILKNTTPEYVPKYARVDTKFVSPEMRPTNEEYDRYMYLASELKKAAYDPRKLSEPYPFQVKDKVFSSIAYASTRRLINMAGELHQDASELRSWMKRFESNITSKLWSASANMFFDLDMRSSKQIEEATVAGLLPIITDTLTAEQRQAVAAHLDKASFCGDDNCAVSLAPSLALDADHFNPHQYWRGPIWVNVNWLLWKAFLANGMQGRARHLQMHILQLVLNEGFWEYYSPLTGKGLGARNFSWTAALAIDLTNENPIDLLRE